VIYVFGEEEEEEEEERKERIRGRREEERKIRENGLRGKSVISLSSNGRKDIFICSGQNLLSQTATSSNY